MGEDGNRVTSPRGREAAHAIIIIIIIIAAV